METSIHSDPQLPRFQAFLSHLGDSVLVCVHTIVVTFIWQEAEHSREMADPE